MTIPCHVAVARLKTDGPQTALLSTFLQWSFGNARSGEPLVRWKGRSLMREPVWKRMVVVAFPKLAISPKGLSIVLCRGP